MAIGVTVVEYQQFRQRASRFLSEDEKQRLIDYLSENPKVGIEFAGTGGIRHLKWPNHAGKDGEKCLVGYYYAHAKMPLHLLNAYKIGEKDLLAKIIETAFAGL